MTLLKDSAKSLVSKFMLVSHFLKIIYFLGAKSFFSAFSAAEHPYYLLFGLKVLKSVWNRILVTFRQHYDNQWYENLRKCYFNIWKAGLKEFEIWMHIIENLTLVQLICILKWLYYKIYYIYLQHIFTSIILRINISGMGFSVTALKCCLTVSVTVSYMLMWGQCNMMQAAVVWAKKISYCALLWDAAVSQTDPPYQLCCCCPRFYLWLWHCCLYSCR